MRIGGYEYVMEGIRLVAVTVDNQSCIHTEFGSRILITQIQTQEHSVCGVRVVWGHVFVCVRV